MLLEGQPLDAPHACGELLKRGLSAYPDALAVMSSVRQLTWSELDAASTALAHQYRALGL